MYAAAGGASLASRKARQGQRQTKKNEKLNQLRGSVSKPPPVGAPGGTVTPVPKSQSRAFHSLPAGYQAGAVKLSRVERNALKPTPVERRHSTSNHLKEPTRARIRESPSVMLPREVPCTLPREVPCSLPGPLLAPNHVGVAATPLSPARLPQILLAEGGERRCSLVRQCEQADEKEREEDAAAAAAIILAQGQERLCCGIPTDGHPLLYSELDQAAYGSLDYPFSECSQGRAAWQEREREQRERRCSLSEAAHTHRVKQTEAHHRWMKRNRIHDTSYGGSSDEEDFFSIYYQSAAANALLYVGLGTTAIGLIISSVASGEKGFKTLELRLIGPVLIAFGLLCCVIRVLLCICPSACLRRRKRTRLKADACPHRFGKETRRDLQHHHHHQQVPHHHHHHQHHQYDDKLMLQHQLEQQGGTSTSEPAGPSGASAASDEATHSRTKKRVSIAPHPVPCTSGTSGGHSPPARLHSERETAARDFAGFNATTPRGAPPVREDSLIELHNLELSSAEVSSVSSADSDSVTIVEAEIARLPTVSKLTRARQPTKAAETNLGGTTQVSAPAPTPAPAPPPPRQPPRTPHSGIVLSPSKLGQ